MTTIEDTLTYIDGSKANGRLVVGWKPFTVGNVNAAGGELEWQIVEGAVSISLYSNTGAQPTGSYYVVKYELENGAVYLEQWIVPDLPTVNLGQVRVAFPPSPSVMISPLQLTSLGAAPGMFLMWNGQRWVPGYPGQFSFVDPTLVKGDMIVRGDVAPATRLGVGADGLVLTADSSKVLGVSWTLVGGASSQSPWVVDIEAAGHKLKNAGNIGIGNDATGLAFAGYPQLIVGPSIAAAQCGLVLACGNASAGAAAVGSFAGVNWAITATDKRVAEMRIDTDAALNSGAFSFNTWNAGVVGEKVRITAAGNVGIGTMSPQSKLHIGGGTSGQVSPILRVEGAGGAGSGAGLVLNTGPLAGSYPDNCRISSLDSGDYGSHILFETKTGGAPGNALAERMRIASSGNVGIGTTGPRSRLAVIPSSDPTTIATSNQITIGEATNNTAYGLSLGYGTLSGDRVSIIQSNSGLAYTLLLNPSGGNVGIGTTGPQVPLHVVKLVSVGPSVPAAGTYGGPVIISNDSVNYGMYIGSLNSGSGYVQQQRGDSAVTYNLLLQPNGGNVGIGTTGPGAKLDVQGGSIRTTDNYSNGSFAVGSQGSYLGRAPADGSTILQTAQGYLLLNPFGGNVMVGSGGPANYKLDVAGDVNTSTVFRVQGLPAARIIAYLDQTGARALNTVYLNTQTCPIFVAVTATINQSQFMQLLTDLGNPPTNVVCTQSNASGSLTITQTLNGWVMPNHYYKVNASGGTLAKWFEWQ